jgi:hypothetical protein
MSNNILDLIDPKDMETYLGKLALYYRVNKGKVRFPQACMNCLPSNIYRKISNTELDVFYKEELPTGWFEAIQKLF